MDKIGGNMEFVNSWINCILSTIVLVGIVELIVPDGETKKFVLLISGIITSIIIVSPVIKFFSDDFSLAAVFDVNVVEDNFYYIDTLRSTVKRQGEVLEEVFSDKVVREFNNTYFDMELISCKISFLRDTSGKIIEVKEVIVKCKNSVDDVSLLKKRVASICETSIDKVRVN